MTWDQPPIHIGGESYLAPRYLTRHVGIFGATGTGKTTTAGRVIEQLRCPTIILDAKGDLAALGRVLTPWGDARMQVDALGSDLMRRVLDLSEAQSGALEIALAWAEDNGVACRTLDDLSALLHAVLRADTSHYGLVSTVSVAAVQRAILRFRRAAPWAFGTSQTRFTSVREHVVIHAPDLVAVPGLYGTFAAHMLESIYGGLAEAGDVDAPSLALVVDEAHLLFDDAPRPVVQRLEQIVRLIRSKGVCLIFVTQGPSDLPAPILGQLATRIQHALRAATLSQQAALRAAAETMPGIVSGADILGLGMGEAYVTTPDARGVPTDAVKVQVQRGKPLDVVFSDAPPSHHSTSRVDISLTPARHEETAPTPPRRRPWYFWPLIVAAMVYGPLLVTG